MVPTAVAEHAPHREDDIKVVDVLEEVDDRAAALQVAKQRRVARIVPSRAWTLGTEGRIFEAPREACVGREERSGFCGLQSRVSTNNDL